MYLFLSNKLAVNAVKTDINKNCDDEVKIEKYKFVSLCVFHLLLKKFILGLWLKSKALSTSKKYWFKLKI